ncbi:PA3496 family putative envelope integrity protein [Halopseudomonas pachastrellae]|uniref:PA3496 family putative envelope integrity protein n=1 Tax=Halopseudomonas pachastrellae TaxID=254161 RepID=UPI003D7C6943|tara:strand:+ start:1175 stop:1357 length:183 start_codon:yes stop_codon:yes gene_type:complete
MAKAKSDIELDDDEDFVEEDDTPDTDSAPNTRNSLTKRRLIDNYLEERRLQKQLSDFDFD